jgi:hypothetical protein
MELFIPSLVALLLGAVVFFALLPQMSPYALGSLAIVLCVVGIYYHYTKFPYEYSSSQLKFMLQDIAPFAMLGASIIGLLVVIMLFFGNSAPSVGSILPAMPEMPEMPNMPNMPNMMNMPNILPANNSNKGMFNLSGNNAKRNNIASTNFKIT